MRFSASFLAFPLLAAAACSGPSIPDECPTGSTSGAAPTCIVSAQCTNTNVGVSIDCSGGNGKCVCLENGIAGATVDYQDAFCSAANGTSMTTADEGALDAANSACGWNL